MSEISIHIPYVLYSVPFIVALIVLIKVRLDARRAPETADYERFIWPEQAEEPEEDARPVSRRYISYST